MSLTKKTMSLLLALVLCVSLALPAVSFAEPVGSPVTPPVTPGGDEEEEVVFIELPPVIGDETVVDMSEVSSDTKEEDLQALQAAAQSAQIAEPANEEEKQMQEAALQSAVDRIDDAAKQQEQQDILAALTENGLVTPNKDGTLPKGTQIEVAREINLKAKALGLTETVNEDGTTTKKLALDLSPVYDLIANVVGGPEQAVTVSQGKPLTIDKPIDLTIDLPEDFVDPDRDFVYVAQTVDGKTRIYRGELGETVDGVRKLSLRTIGLSPIEITTEDNMVAKITEDMDGVNVNLYYPTLAEAVEEVKNEGVITLVKPVTESINSIKDKVFTVELDPIVNEEEVHLTVDGKEASFTDRSLTIPVN